MNYHILTQAKDQNTVNVVFHIPIPIANNSVGVPWKTALLKKLGTVTSVLSDISGAELALLQSCELLETSETVRFSSIYLTNAERLQEVGNRYSARKIQLLEELGIELNFMGYGGDV